MTSHEHRDLRGLFFEEFGRNNMSLFADPVSMKLQPTDIGGE